MSTQVAVRGRLMRREAVPYRVAIVGAPAGVGRATLYRVRARVIGIRPLRLRAWPDVIGRPVSARESAFLLPRSRPPAERRCDSCRRMSKFGNCLEPVRAGISERFQLVRHPEGGDGCAIYTGRSTR